MVLAFGDVRAEAENEIACGPDQAGWRRGDIDLASAPLDLRFLNDVPAGKHGFLEARGESLVFADGTPARFWGVNVAAKAIFDSTDAEIDWQAERIARLGFNLVRLHHHDATAWLRGGGVVAFGPASSRELNPDGMAKLDRWIASLRRNGIYVWLDLFTSRSFHRGDAIPGFDEIERNKFPSGVMGHGFLFVNPRLQELVIEFGEKLLAHRNALTGLVLRDDPAIAAVLIANEDDVTHHFGNLFAADKSSPWHRARFIAEAETFSRRTHIPLARLLETWKPGPSKKLLADLEHRFAVTARARLRAAGLKAPLALSSFWNGEPYSSLPSLASGDFLDVHAYVSGNPLANPPQRWGGLVARIGAAQLVGKPVMVSEWNHGEPRQRERGMATLWLASTAALQDWDGLVLYGYAQDRFSRLSPTVWNTAADPAVAALLPAAALLYRRGDVARARERLVVALAPEQVWDEELVPERHPALALAVERHRVAIELPATPELAWLVAGSREFQARAKDLAATPAPVGSVVRSDTGELTRDFAAGVHTIDAPLTQAASGEIAGRDFALSSVRIRPARDGAIAFTSLDGKTLARSDRVLVSLAARACADPGPTAAFRAEPFAGSAWLAGDRDRVLVPLDARGERGSTHALARLDGGSVVQLDFGSSWALIEPAASVR
jgi:hypothetical protein